jgi:calcineurin-like phosphoesterase family protein
MWLQRKGLGKSESNNLKHLIFGNDDKPRRTIKESDLFASLANSHTHTSCHGSMLLVHRPQDAPPGDVPVLHGHTHAMPDEADLRFVSVSVDKTDWGPITLEEVWRRFEQRRASH